MDDDPHHPAPEGRPESSPARGAVKSSEGRARKAAGGVGSAGSRRPATDPDCEPPAPPDFLARRLFAGVGPGGPDGAAGAASPASPAGPAGRPPELELLALLSSSRAPLRALFRRQGISVEDAEDLLQEALLIVTERWQDIKEPCGYLLGTVRNLSRMHRRRLQGERQVRFELGQVEPAAAGEVPQRLVDCQLDARQLLARLPEPSRRIVEMRYGEELSSRDVALALDCSEAGVRQSASRAVRRLRRYAAASPCGR
jgi:RNA polymerase sigma factor (sigma-70 family)